MIPLPADDKELTVLFWPRVKKMRPVANRAFRWIVCLLLLALLANLTFAQDDCPELFRRYSEKHTYCLPPNEDCTILIRNISPEDPAKILWMHNEKRNKIAMGKESIGNLPPAADMMEMVWDNELAAVAQKHAEQCKFEHDCSECREIKNFAVNQNLYESWTVGDEIPEPNWQDAVDSWYDEIKYFNKKMVSSFAPDDAPGVIGHFTQTIWSSSWRAGCGYVVHKNGKEYRQLYVCNYGPRGNIMDAPVYEAGKPCSHCPINSCCGKSCNGLSAFDGLCKLVDLNGPRFPREGIYDYFCDFEQPLLCGFETPVGMKQWEVSHTLSGSYIGIVLEGGEASSLNITIPFKAADPSCMTVFYRKGPNAAGQPTTGEATERFEFTQQVYGFDAPLTEDTAQFVEYGMNLNFDNEFKFSVSFSVPEGSPAQYFEMKDISLAAGPCDV